jgi:hypothetical protein
MSETRVRPWNADHATTRLAAEWEEPRSVQDKNDFDLDFVLS